jgi:hypothetical protein
MKTVTVSPMELKALDAMIGAWKRAERQTPQPAGRLQALCELRDHSAGTCDDCLLARAREGVRLPIAYCVLSESVGGLEARAVWRWLIEVRRRCEVKLTVLQKLRALVLGRSA